MNPSMFAPAHPVPMGTVVGTFEAVVAPVMPRLKPVVLPVMPVPLVTRMGKRRCGDRKRGGSADKGIGKLAHVGLSLPCVKRLPRHN